MYSRQLFMIILLVAITTNGCLRSKVANKTSSTNYVIIELNENTYAPIDKEFKSAELSNNEVEILKHILLIAISENNIDQLLAIRDYNKKNQLEKKAETGFELSLDNMDIQLVPYFNTKGEKLVWVNVFCRDEIFTYWKQEIVVVEDGGNCHYNLKINLNKSTYKELYINGYA